MTATKAKKNEGAWVMLIESEDSIASSLKTEMEENGYRVLTASRGNQAMKMLSNQQFGCVILDYSIENGAADVVLGFMKKNPNSLNFSTPVIVTNGEFKPDLLQKLARRIHGAILKPFINGDVIAKITTVCPP